MLDPLTAISLASCVVQFTEFGIKLVSGSIELYHSVDGANAERSSLEFKIIRLQRLADKIIVPPEQNDDGRPASKDERELEYLAESCKSIALDLLSVLEDLKVKKTPGLGRKWESFQKAVEAQTPWNRKKIAALEKDLLRSRQQMFDQIQIMMSEQQSKTFLTLKDLADEKLVQMKTKILTTLEDTRKEVNGAIETLSNQLLSLAEDSRTQKIRCIIDSLDFETRQSRQSDIADTEDRTFEWIFHDHHGTLSQNIGFRKWLQSGDNIYWISGKAGSGKSVLMNYIANALRTQEMLQSWAGDTRLLIAKYYFWNAGAPMQKSQQGLLQSLLREIYGQCPELVPVCPRWKRYYDISASWTRHELSEAFRKLSQQRLLHLKFCFFVDGVDEYDGDDYKHIIDVLKDLNSSPSVKICLSSRPWNIFVAAFGADTDQRLLLEDHNGDDIQQYVKNRFGSDEHFALLQSKDPQSSDLIDQVVRNAQGVFLWVRIVVTNLLRGLSNDDNLSDLHKRLQSFPTTLTAYFQHMFDRIDDFYREETAEILLICLEGIPPLSLLALWFYEKEKERATPDYALHADRTPLSRADVVAIFESIHKRINARGQDLLVIEANTTNLEYSMYTVRFSHRTVKDFLSKPDMLKKLTSWKSKDFDANATLCKATLAIMKSLPLSTNMNIVNNYNRCWSHVTDFFSYARVIEEDGGTLDEALVDEFQRVFSSFRTRDKRDTYLERLLSVSAWALDHWARWIHEHDVAPAINWPYGFLFRPERNMAHDRDMTDLFLALAVEANLKRYIGQKLATNPHMIDRASWKRPILDRALRPPPLLWQTCRIDPDMVHLLLMRGADPNEELALYIDRWSKDGPSIYESAKSRLLTYTSEKAWTTVWALFLQRLYEAKLDKSRKSPDSIHNELEATKLMIENGADADLRPWKILPFRGPTLTPSDVFHKVFPTHDAEVLDQLLKKRRPWAFRQAGSWARRTVLLWFYRDIHIVLWSLTSLYHIIFNETTGVILPMVIIPTLVYLLLLVWPFVLFVISGTAPVLLSALILSDWIPIVDGLIWFNNLLVWRNTSFVYKKRKND